VSDLILIAQVVATGSHKAFAKLVEAHQAPVRRFLQRLTHGDAMRADDLAQETFIRAWQHIGDFRGLSGFETWLMRIAYRLFLDDERKNKEHTLSLDEENHDRLENIAAFASPIPNKGGAGAGAASGGALGLSMDLDLALGTLSEAERTCVTLQCIEGYSIRDIAGITGLNENTIKSHLARGKQHLAAFLRKNGYG